MTKRMTKRISSANIEKKKKDRGQMRSPKGHQGLLRRGFRGVQRRGLWYDADYGSVIISTTRVMVVLLLVFFLNLITTSTVTLAWSLGLRFKTKKPFPQSTKKKKNGMTFINMVVVMAFTIVGCLRISVPLWQKRFNIKCFRTLKGERPQCHAGIHDHQGNNSGPGSDRKSTVLKWFFWKKMWPRVG